MRRFLPQNEIHILPLFGSVARLVSAICGRCPLSNVQESALTAASRFSPLCVDLLSIFELLHSPHPDDYYHIWSMNDCLMFSAGLRRRSGMPRLT
ncbi:hypothetical protein BD626DRAFT_39285 [Schizophyllum amplum]|uniref:Uncharacterized protein n=1 Tax=Schizophyllum amplum TaxID=97359 RepID=A0A550BSY2_9AGAR|nr:hypothetical protein BD626DRAFT_39285 [Auriculariopsis ampla]